MPHPAVTASDPKGSPGPETPSNRLPLRALLVEDNPDDVAIVLRLLRRAGYEPTWRQVQTAADLTAALAESGWDIVLSDYTMPQFDALSALRIVREESAFLPFVIISGSIGEDTAVAAMRAGASDYLMKANLARLGPAIERELREAAGRRERTRTKKALLDMQDKFQVIFHEYLEVMMVLDAFNGDILHVNRAILPVLGYDANRLGGQPFEVLWPESRRATAAALLERVRREGSVFYSGNFTRLDGSNCPMDILANKVNWGRSDAIIVTLRDVSERHDAERKLAAEKEHLAVTLRSIGEGVITTNTAGAVLLVNSAAEQLTGWTQAEVVDKPLSEVLPLSRGPGEPLDEDIVALVLNSGQIVEMTRGVQMQARDGCQIALAVTAAPIRGQDAKMIGVVLIFRDITGEQKMEEELQKASRLESVALLAGGIAHDFNNILTAIMGHLSLARANGTPVETLVSTVEKACLYATDLTRQLLTFAKGGTPNRQVEAVESLVREIVEFALHGSNLRCTFALPEGLHRVDVDRNQIQQVLNNLVINAIQATPGSGTLRVSAENVSVDRDQPIGTLAPGDYVRIALQDSGAGISPEHLSRIFDPYFTTKSTGSGLGLSTSYSILRNHGGLIQAESQPGVGTTFSIYLPRSLHTQSQPIASPILAARAAVPHGGGRVLFMDDETILQELVAAMLDHLGYEVVCASHGEEVLELYTDAKAAGQPFDAVIVDLTVPGGMGGYEAVQRLLCMDPMVKAIVSSGYSNDPIMAEFQDHGFTGVIAKPYQLVELGKVLQKVIDAPAAPSRCNAGK